jgi:hypothetical protein
MEREGRRIPARRWRSDEGKEKGGLAWGHVEEGGSDLGMGREVKAQWPGSGGAGWAACARRAREREGEARRWQVGCPGSEPSGREREKERG